ncbi:peroxiredoxin-like family protein [Trinickia caryophylli]|uniref:Peroxiredoxin n=1 Tax=Trinickia caryophylli TaxID=28094 RepID=A0A1X7D1N7_TRICW|nr:peroxiredoxin-like family protein [Trinickia caryophylli]PMS13563.1 AhpC/TSA family protein [Trinickia caryophylli]TRX15269.1 AhpC/TSA family protein [Trinickia caryophylli]WQE15145.1 peroxiredoxin-like family protein [Trinickia caryophylli]SMF06652.1 Peroxiredoxin [Trinickia caryophylli]GLU31116.1 thioredoxin peroxidase [Trinickia caryophylli]
MLIPRTQAPALNILTVAHGPFELAREAPGYLTLVSFYRGLHCPICAVHLKELERLTPAFAERGVKTIAVSSDSETRARQMADKVGAGALRIGYGLPLATARAWGLYLSASKGETSIGIEEPAIFSEPGLFLIRPDTSVYYASVQSMPFARPAFPDLLKALDFTIEHAYPARGEYVGAA